MLLGHWQEMKAIGQAQGALAALAELLPDEAERVARRRRGRDACRVDDLRVGDVVLVRSGRPGPGRRRDRRGRRRARRVDDHRRVPAGRPRRRATGWSPARWRPTRRSGCGSRRSATTPRWPASSASSPRRRPVRGRAQALADRFAALLFYVATARRRDHVRRVVGARRPRRGRRAHRHRAGDRLPARPRPGHPAGDRAVDRGRRPGPASWSRTGWRSSGCAPSTPCCSTRPAR